MLCSAHAMNSSGDYWRVSQRQFRSRKGGPADGHGAGCRINELNLVGCPLDNQPHPPLDPRCQGPRRGASYSDSHRQALPLEVGEGVTSPRPVRHYEDAVGRQDRLVDLGRDEDDGVGLLIECCPDQHLRVSAVLTLRGYGNEHRTRKGEANKSGLPSN